jgi:hypothetical protein
MAAKRDSLGTVCHSTEGVGLQARVRILRTGPAGKPGRAAAHVRHRGRSALDSSKLQEQMVGMHMSLVPTQASLQHTSIHT